MSPGTDPLELHLLPKRMKKIDLWSAKFLPALAVYAEIKRKDERTLFRVFLEMALCIQFSSVA